MHCPKCKTEVDDNISICPTCKKVLQVECPNCHALGQSAVCEECGYTVLVKCSKCSRINPIEKVNCSKCGFSLATSLAYQECENDDFAAIVITFENLKNIKKSLKKQSAYEKFLLKVEKIIMAQLKNVEVRTITYKNSYVVNFNKELSLATSSNKAVRLALKIINAFVDLNMKLWNNLENPLGLKLRLVKKESTELLDYPKYKVNVKQLRAKAQKKYLKGLYLEMDQHVWEQINKSYKTDSLYTVDKDGVPIMFYELILDDYVLPPQKGMDEAPYEAKLHSVQKNVSEEEDKDLRSFNIFDINAKCAFEQSTAVELIDKLKSINLKKNGKIITIKSNKDNAIDANEIIKFYKQNDYNVISVCCTEITSYTPWGFFQNVFKDFFALPRCNEFINPQKINPVVLQKYKKILDLILSKPVKASMYEDARFAYMEMFGEFLGALNNTVIVVEGIEFLDDTSLQTLSLYFDKFKKVIPNFVFINNTSTVMHSKIKGLLRTSLYTEISLKRSSFNSMVSALNKDLTIFKDSFYYEKIQENCRGSLLYFENAIEYLKEIGVIIDFNNKYMVKDSISVILPKGLESLYKTRIKNYGKKQDISLILAYSVFLGPRLDFTTLSALKINDIQNNAKVLVESNLARVENDVLYINNYSTVAPAIKSILKQDVRVYLVKNILANIGKSLDDASMAFLMEVLGVHKEHYLTLWKNSQFAIKTGDYDAYLKNCLAFLSLVDKIKANISPEELEQDKKDVYNNILMCLYAYSPEKIYFIENILLMDAIKEGDNEKIIKLSNLMLQGALISSNYTDALGLLHNILSRTPNATWYVDGKVNTKFVLLSLVNIEILYNIGDYRACVQIGNELLNVLKAEILEEVKPVSFSLGLFISHILETLRLVCFAKIYLHDNDLEEFFEKIKQALDVEYEDKMAIYAIKNFLARKEYEQEDLESATPFSKVVYLILQECSSLKDDYKTFAQNIYQAKLLAVDIHQEDLSSLCDMLIAFAYFKAGQDEKAESIFYDILNSSDKNALFNTLLLSKYFIALLKLSKSQKAEALQLVNDALALLQKFDNQSRIMFVLFEKMFIDMVKEDETISIDLNIERKKLVPYKESLAFLFNEEDFVENLEENNNDTTNQQEDAIVEVEGIEQIENTADN